MSAKLLLATWLQVRSITAQLHGLMSFKLNLQMCLNVCKDTSQKENERRNVTRDNTQYLLRTRAQIYARELHIFESAAANGLISGVLDILCCKYIYIIMCIYDINQWSTRHFVL
jgi:hypothetical protein